MADYQFTVIVERDEDGLFVVSVPALPGCHTQGETYDESLKNIREAIRLYIDALRDLGEPIPVEVGTTKVRVIA